MEHNLTPGNSSLFQLLSFHKCASRSSAFIGLNFCFICNPSQAYQRKHMADEFIKARLFDLIQLR